MVNNIIRFLKKNERFNKYGQSPTFFGKFRLGEFSFKENQASIILVNINR